MVTWWWLNESWGLPTRPKLPSATASPSHFLSATSNSPPQPHECVDSPLARSPAGKSGLKLLHTSWGSAECVPIYGHLPHYSWRRVRPNLPHANLKIGPGPRKRPPASCIFIHQSEEVDVWSWIASKLGFNPNSLGNKTAWLVGGRHHLSSALNFTALSLKCSLMRAQVWLRQVLEPPPLPRMYLNSCTFVCLTLVATCWSRLWKI